MSSSRTAARAGRQKPSRSAAGRPLPRATRSDAVRNYQRILDAAREVLGESGADASMEEIAARAGVGVGTVYRRFASKDAMIDELMRLAMEQLLAAADQALAMTDGHGLQELMTVLRPVVRRPRALRQLAARSPVRPGRQPPDTSGDRRAHRPRRGCRHDQRGHHLRRHPGADLGHARPRPGGRQHAAVRLAALPGHPPGRLAGSAIVI